MVMIGEEPAVLVVDDHAANRRLYRAVLKDSGASIVEAATGADALAACKSRRFAMILLDVHLGGIDGFEVARELRAAGGANATTPIVFVSAIYVHEDDAFRGYRLGAVDYILSPVVPEILRAKVATFVRLERAHAEVLAQRRAAEQAYRELRHAHAELEHFSWAVSHDLRTPLAQLTGLVELLRQHATPQLDAKAQGYLDHIAGAATRMRTLIDELLALAQTTRAELRHEPIDLSAMAAEIAAELQSGEPQRTARISIERGLVAAGDARLVRSALANLLGNAWKYTAGVGAPQIEFGRVESGATAEFYVRDNGSGFDVDAAGERLFRPFQRFNADSRYAGNGIGLAIVERVVARHGGRIRAESAPGAGASFFFTLEARGDGAPATEPRE